MIEVIIEQTFLMSSSEFLSGGRETLIGWLKEYFLNAEYDYEIQNSSAMPEAKTYVCHKFRFADKHNDAALGLKNALA